MDTITSLRPNVTREQAMRRFRGGPVARAARRVLRAPLRAVADWYLPFTLFRVQVGDGKQLPGRLFALDGIDGSLDLYGFDEDELGPGALVTVETRNHPQRILDEQQSRDLLVQKLTRVVLSRGFFRVRDLHISAEPVALDLHIPYWLGFFGSGDRVSIAVMDAVRSRLEGPKLRQSVSRWLTPAA